MDTDICKFIGTISVSNSSCCDYDTDYPPVIFGKTFEDVYNHIITLKPSGLNTSLIANNEFSGDSYFNDLETARNTNNVYRSNYDLFIFECKIIDFDKEFVAIEFNNFESHTINNNFRRSWTFNQINDNIISVQSHVEYFHSS